MLGLVTRTHTQTDKNKQRQDKDHVFFLFFSFQNTGSSAFFNWMLFVRFVIGCYVLFFCWMLFAGFVLDPFLFFVLFLLYCMVSRFDVTRPFLPSSSHTTP